jgi:hypothetical protein
MTKKQNSKIIEIKPNSQLDGKTFCCSEVFTLDKKGKIIKREWKREEEKDWQW